MIVWLLGWSALWSYDVVIRYMHGSVWSYGMILWSGVRVVTGGDGRIEGCVRVYLALFAGSFWLKCGAFNKTRLGVRLAIFGNTDLAQCRVAFIES